jgi:hypothetical protein
MKVGTVRRIIFAEWLGGAAVPFLIVFAQTLGGRYGQRPQEAWAWLLPAVLPTLGLMSAVVLNASTSSAEVPKFTALFAIGMSALYLALVAATLLLQPFSPFTASELFAMSHLWLAPAQGLCAAAIAAIFLSADEEGAG